MSQRRDSNSQLCLQHHVPPEPQRRSLPDVCSKPAADASDGPHEEAAGLWREPVGLSGNTDTLSEGSGSQTGPVTSLTLHVYTPDLTNSTWQYL